MKKSSREIDTAKLNPPIIVTVYRVTYPGLQKVQEYYQWDWGTRDEDQAQRVTSCPGCGQNLNYKPHSHKCAGTLLPNPIDKKWHQSTGKFTDTQRARQFKEYLSRQTHDIQLSE